MEVGLTSEWARCAVLGHGNPRPSVRPEWAGRAGFQGTAHRLAVDFRSVHSLGKCETVKLVTAAKTCFFVLVNGSHWMS